jgi:hypothetical protein
MTDHPAAPRVVSHATSTSDTSSTVDLETAADILYALGSPETYRLLVVDRGWSASQFERWYGQTLERLLLDRIRPGPLKDSR